MMRFTLACERGHDFEAWFGGNADYEEQRGRGLVECPHCGSTKVGKALMAPSVATARARTARGEAVSGALATAERAALRERMGAFVRHVRENTTDVGERFPEEARRIHYGEAEERGIRGRASADEAKALREEGVGIAPLPSLPEEAN